MSYMSEAGTGHESSGLTVPYIDLLILLTSHLLCCCNPELLNVKAIDLFVLVPMRARPAQVLKYGGDTVYVCETFVPTVTVELIRNNECT